jgi:hypothetical protein
LTLWNVQIGQVRPTLIKHGLITIFPAILELTNTSPDTKFKLLTEKTLIPVAAAKFKVLSKLDAKSKNPS